MKTAERVAKDSFKLQGVKNNAELWNSLDWRLARLFENFVTVPYSINNKKNILRIQKNGYHSTICRDVIQEEYRNNKNFYCIYTLYKTIDAVVVINDFDTKVVKFTTKDLNIFDIYLKYISEEDIDEDFEYEVDEAERQKDFEKLQSKIKKMQEEEDKKIKKVFNEKKEDKFSVGATYMMDFVRDDKTTGSTLLILTSELNDNNYLIAKCTNFLDFCSEGDIEFKQHEDLWVAQMDIQFKMNKYELEKLDFITTKNSFQKGNILPKNEDPRHLIFKRLEKYDVLDYIVR